MTFEATLPFIVLAAGLFFHYALPGSWMIALPLDLIAVGFFFGFGKRREMTNAA